MPTHRRSIVRDSAECIRSEAALCSERMYYSCDSTEHLANDLTCPKMAPRSQAVMQQRAETLDDPLIRELLKLRAERAHLHKTSSSAQVHEQCNGVGEEPGVVTSVAKVNRCSGHKLATTYSRVPGSRNRQVETADWILAGFLHYFRNLLAGIWGSFLRFIETGFKNWLVAFL